MDARYSVVHHPQAWVFPICGLLPPPLVFKATPSDPDTLTFDEAMRDVNNIAKWMGAASKEISSLEKNGTWKVVPIIDARSKILPGTWVFKRKRTPDGEISKYKARYCVRGDLEDGEPETFAPVVAWATVRLFLVLSLTLGWDTCSIDFSSAFVQANLEHPVWIHLPRGFRTTEGQGMCLLLLKSLYGLTVAPRLWYEHVSEALPGTFLRFQGMLNRSLPAILGDYHDCPVCRRSGRRIFQPKGS